MINLKEIKNGDLIIFNPPFYTSCIGIVLDRYFDQTNPCMDIKYLPITYIKNTKPENYIWLPATINMGGIEHVYHCLERYTLANGDTISPINFNCTNIEVLSGVGLPCAAISYKELLNL